jgi:transcriptional regulator with XRE-family HTH domain
MKSALAWYREPKELKKRREEIGLSADELAQRAGKSLSVVKNIESGRTKLRGQTAHALWRAITNAKIEQDKSLGALLPASNLLHADPDKMMRVEKLVHEHFGSPDAIQALLDAGGRLEIQQQRIVALESEVVELRSALAEIHEKLRSGFKISRRVTSRQGEKILAENSISSDTAERSKS